MWLLAIVSVFLLSDLKRRYHTSVTAGRNERLCIATKGINTVLSSHIQFFQCFLPVLLQQAWRQRCNQQMSCCTDAVLLYETTGSRRGWWCWCVRPHLDRWHPAGAAEHQSHQIWQTVLINLYTVHLYVIFISLKVLKCYYHLILTHKLVSSCMHCFVHLQSAHLRLLSSLVFSRFIMKSSVKANVDRRVIYIDFIQSVLLLNLKNCMNKCVRLSSENCYIHNWGLQRSSVGVYYWLMLPN